MLIDILNLPLPSWEGVLVLEKNNRWFTRFAPSPTGFLHIGHLIHLLYVWKTAIYLGAEIILRIENHDKQRCKQIYVDGILEDLTWLGLTNYTISSAGLLQTERNHLYEIYLSNLKDKGEKLYGCKCSRKEITDHLFFQQALTQTQIEVRYPNICRELNLSSHPPNSLRIAISDEIVYFNDIILGKQIQQPAAQCGDILLRDKLGNWTYQFSVVVDDILDNINLVIRGIDLLQSTGRQLLLNRKLGGNNLITYFHHPIIYDDRGYKLSKRNNSTTIKELRKKGMSIEAVINLALTLLRNEITN